MHRTDDSDRCARRPPWVVRSWYSEAPPRTISPHPFSRAMAAPADIDPLHPATAESAATLIAMPAPVAGTAPLHPAAAESAATLIALPAPATGIAPLHPAAAAALPAAFAPPAPAAAMSFEKDRACPRGPAAA